MGGLTLIGCTTTTDTTTAQAPAITTPSATPTLTERQQAIQQATDTALTMLTRFDTLTREGQPASGLKALKPLMTADFFASEVAANETLRLTGPTSFEIEQVKRAKIAEDGNSTVRVLLCKDMSKAKLIDTSTNEVIYDPAERPKRFLVDITLVTDKTGNWRVESGTAPTTKGEVTKC